MERISGAEAIVRSLIAEGVEVIFGYPGGTIMPFYDALYNYSDKIHHVLVRHEQGATHAAEGYARVLKKPGVCVATSGPGATNLITGIADAMMDSIPMVCITGQVGSAVLGTDAFQETDVLGVTIPITKWNYQISKAAEIPKIIAKAFYIARTGRPGPVVIDITKNAQIEKFDFEYEVLTSLDSYRVKKDPDSKLLQAAADLINAAQRPFLFVGHGVQISGAEDLVLALSEKAGIPAASTLLGLSVFPQQHPLYVGMLGMHGHYGPNLLSNKADVVIAVGMRFDDRVTGDLSKYLKDAQVIHIEIDHGEIDKNVRTAVALHCDAKPALQQLLPLIKANVHQAWLQEFRRCDQIEYDRIIKAGVEPKDGGLRMPEVISLLAEKTKGEALVVSDVGQNQMMTARYYRFSKPNSYITSGGLGTMGFALPAALGCKIAAPDREVIAIIGDGAFQMKLQELGTIHQEQAAVKVIVMNNGYLGMVRQWQELFFEKRYSFTTLKNPDFVKICEGFGIRARRVALRGEIAAALDELIASREAYVLEVLVEKEENVFPMVPAGASVSDVRLE